MLVVSKITENLEEFTELMLKRNIDIKPKLLNIVELDKKRRTTQSNLDNLLSESNQIAKKVGELYKNGNMQKAEIFKEKAASLKKESKAISELLNKIAFDLKSLFDLGLYDPKEKS